MQFSTVAEIIPNNILSIAFELFAYFVLVVSVWRAVIPHILWVFCSVVQQLIWLDPPKEVELAGCVTLKIGCKAMY